MAVFRFMKNLHREQEEDLLTGQTGKLEWKIQHWGNFGSNGGIEPSQVLSSHSYKYSSGDDAVTRLRCYRRML